MNFISTSKKNNSILVNNNYRKPPISLSFHPKNFLHNDLFFRTVSFQGKDYVFAYNEFTDFFNSLPFMHTFNSTKQLDLFRVSILSTKDFSTVASLFKVYFVFARNFSLLANEVNFQNLVPLTLETIALWNVLAPIPKDEDLVKRFLATTLMSIHQDVQNNIEDFKQSNTPIPQLILVKQVLSTFQNNDLSKYEKEEEQLRNIYHTLCHIIKSFKAPNVFKQVALIADIRIKALTDSLKKEFFLDTKKRIIDGSLTILKISKNFRRLEEKRVTELFAYSGFNLSTSIYTFSSLNTLRITSALSSKISLGLQNFKTKIVAKPKITPFLNLFDIVQKYPKALNPILSKLQNQDHLKVFLCSLHQLLDLHPRNIAIKPLTEDESIFKDHFFYINKKYDLCEILMMYFTGVIKDTTTIYLNSIKNPVSIASYSPLKVAVNAPWEIQLFDLDFSIAECNLLNFYDIQKAPDEKYQQRTIIPLNNSFLYLKDFANIPLTPQLISIIKHELKNLLSMSFEKNVWPWNFIRKQDHQSLEEMIIAKGLLKEFSSSTSKASLNLSEIKTAFAKDLSDLKKHLDFWQKIDSMLIAFGLSGWYGSKHVKLLDPESKDERFKFAKALFPKDTVFQMNARNKRITSSLKYIECYEKVLKATSGGDPETILKDIENLINIPGLKNPFELDQQMIFFANFKENPQIEHLMNLIDIILKEYRPTHFRFACVMYPLLSTFERLKNLSITNNDTHELLNALNYYGYIENSFEECITRAKIKSFATNAEEINFLEKVFLNVKDTLSRTFFSYYGTFISTSK